MQMSMYSNEKQRLSVTQFFESVSIQKWRAV